MWAKIVLCCFIWMSVFGNAAWAESKQPTDPSKQSQNTAANTQTQQQQIGKQTTEGEKKGKPSTKTPEEADIKDLKAYFKKQWDNVTDRLNDVKQNIKDAETKRKDLAEAEKEKEKAKDAQTNGPFGQCSTFAFDFACNMSNWTWYWVTELLKAVGQWMLKVVFIQDNLATNETIKEFQNNFVSLAWTFLMVFLTYQMVRILSMMILQEDHSEIKPLIRKVVVIAALIPSSLWICSKLFTLGNDFSEYYIQTELNKLPEKLYGLNFLSSIVNVRLLLILLIVLLVLLIIIAFQMAIRQAEFAFLVVIGPIAIVTMINKEINLFSLWWRNLLAVVFTQSLQVLMLVITFRLMTENSLTILTTCLGFLVLTMGVPKKTNEWFGANSSQSAAGGMVRSAANFTASMYTGRTTTKEAARGPHSLKGNKKK
jgi:hypothetical protein